MPQLGPAEVLVILVVALLVFGPKRLPEVGRQVGRGLRELRKIQETVRDELNDVLHSPDEAAGVETPSITSRSSGEPPEPDRERPALPPTKARPAPSRYRAPGS
jgi:sec-independent protein translocase protein TatA